MNVTHLECALCGKEHEARKLHNLCRECGKPLLVRYDLESAARTLTKFALVEREANLWRYREVLPVEDWTNVVSFGEGWTPLLGADRLAAKLPVRLDLYIKDEGQNPTQSFKARGMTAAISMAKEFGVKKVAVPSAGNAAGAMGLTGGMNFGPQPGVADQLFSSRKPFDLTDSTQDGHGRN